MELLPNDIQLIVHRYIFDDMYRRIQKEYKRKRKIACTESIYIKLGQTRQEYNWRELNITSTHLKSVFSKDCARVASLSPNYIHAQLM